MYQIPLIKNNSSILNESTDTSIIPFLYRVLDRFSRTERFDYKGYFLINDDSCIDPHQLNTMNLSSSFGEGRSRYNPESKWYWIQFKNERQIVSCCF